VRLREDGGGWGGTHGIVDYSFDGHEDLQAVGHCGLCGVGKRRGV